MSDLAFLSTYYPFIPPVNASTDALRVLGCIKDINIIAVLASGDPRPHAMSDELWKATLTSVGFVDGLVSEVHVRLDASGVYDFAVGDTERVTTYDISLNVAYIGFENYPVGSYVMCSDTPLEVNGHVMSGVWAPPSGIGEIRVHPDSILFVQLAPRISVLGLGRPGNPIRREDTSYTYDRNDVCEIDEYGVEIQDPYILGKGMSLALDDGYNVSIRPVDNGISIQAGSGYGLGEYAARSASESLPYDELFGIGTGAPARDRITRNNGVAAINGISGNVFMPDVDNVATIRQEETVLTIDIPEKG